MALYVEPRVIAPEDTISSLQVEVSKFLSSMLTGGLLVILSLLSYEIYFPLFYSGLMYSALFTVMLTGNGTRFRNLPLGKSGGQFLLGTRSVSQFHLHERCIVRLQLM